MKFTTMLSSFTLGTRLLFLFTTLLMVSIVTVGASSYLKARSMALDTVEHRLEREAN